MQKVVSFYEKLPRGPAPEPEAKGLLGRYQKKYMGKNPSAKRECTRRDKGKTQALSLSLRDARGNTKTDPAQPSFTSLAS
jgi:hypothetical protein